MARQVQIVSSWSLLLDDFNTSALEFYGAVQAALQERKVPDVKVERTTWHEGGLFSAKREYLRVSRGELAYDICAAPYGAGYFFSAWLLSKEPIPVISWLMSFFGRRAFTLYNLDTQRMFQQSVHRVVTDTISGLRTAKGLRALSPDEMRVTMKDATS